MHWFIDPILKQYADFNGRVTRQPFWLFVLIYIVVSAIVSTIAKALDFEILTALYGLVLLIPSIAITTRRLHDTNRSGWWQLLWFIPLLGWLVIVIFVSQDTIPVDNTYGQNPKAQPLVTPNTATESQESGTL